jgi:hypothetical protein
MGIVVNVDEVEPPFFQPIGPQPRQRPEPGLHETVESRLDNTSGPRACDTLVMIEYERVTNA